MQALRLRANRVTVHVTRTFANNVKHDLVVTSTKNAVTTIRMNDPKKLNGWTTEMTDAFFGAIKQADADTATNVIVLTGTDPYYCAGVNLAGSLKLAYPKTLLNSIISRNQAVFDTFLTRKTPIIVAVNGPAIGASVTSATLCDAILASDKATFSTPFGRLAVPPEGCSSVHFDFLMGKENATRMLQHDWVPTAKEAVNIGLITRVVPHEDLLSAAQSLAEEWVKEGRHEKAVTAMGFADMALLQKVNAEESVALGHAFLGEKFLSAQVKFLESKGKTQLASLFRNLLLTRPVWKMFM